MESSTTSKTLAKELGGTELIRKKSALNEKERETLYKTESVKFTDEFFTHKDLKYVLLFFSAGWCPPCEQFL
jgi:thiol-disulfide isomerase/thioredoxin